jgi:hypothetical protein
LPYKQPVLIQYPLITEEKFNLAFGINTEIEEELNMFVTVYS